MSHHMANSPARRALSEAYQGSHHKHNPITYRGPVAHGPWAMGYGLWVMGPRAHGPTGSWPMGPWPMGPWGHSLSIFMCMCMSLYKSMSMAFLCSYVADLEDSGGSAGVGGFWGI